MRNELKTLAALIFAGSHPSGRDVNRCEWAIDRAVEISDAIDKIESENFKTQFREHREIQQAAPKKIAKKAAVTKAPAEQEV